ncbi:MAG TPA: hypothetical protein DDY13_13235 [Cytophagales bacterium]|jgi:hypothetical protein|nr:hypothetical protein [Cytophagales bacterium]
MAKVSRYKTIGSIRNIILAFVLWIGTIQGYAQTTDTTRLVIEDGWIEKMNTKIAADISFNNAYQIFEVNTTTNRILLYPNTPNNLRLKVNYDFLSVGFQVSPDFLPGNGDNDIRGKTKSFQLGAALIFKHWFAELNYSEVSGYYLKNTEDFRVWEKGDPYIQFPDLHYNGFSISSGYTHNSRFSLRSLSSQTERQLKSTGSFMPVFNFDYYTIDDRSDGMNTQKSKNAEVNIGPGYAYTFVAREKFYASLGLFASLGYMHTWLTTRTPEGNINVNQDNFILRWHGRTGIGYNGPRFYTGLYANVAGTRYNQENTTVFNTETRIMYHLFFGMRFTAPRFLQRQVKQIKKKMP